MAKKCLFTASTFSHIDHFHRPYLAEFRKLGWEVHIACGGTEIEIQEANKSFFIPFEKSIASSKNFKAQYEIRKIIRKNNYDLIITHTSLAAFFTRCACKFMPDRPKIINVVHGYLFTDKTNPIKKAVYLLAEKITAKQTDLLLTMNQYDTDIATKYNLCNIVQKIPGIGKDFSERSHMSSLSSREEFGFSDDDIILIYPAEFSKRKNQEFLIKALPRLSDNVKLILPGEGVMLDYCKQLSSTLNLDNRVFFPGYINDITSLLEISDIAVSSSISEGLPFNILEAMNHNLPIVASNIKGHEDLLNTNNSESLFDLNDKKDFVKKINIILNDKQKPVTYSNLKNYSLQSVLPLIMTEYLKIVTGEENE